MAFKILILFMASTVVQGFVITNSNQQTIDRHNVVNEMVFVGSVENKSFFADTGPQGSWYEAKAACSRANMRLASVATPNQANLLFSKKALLGSIDAWFHTSARDSHTINQFVYDHNGQPSANAGLPVSPPTSLAYQTCVLYGPNSGEKGWLTINLCTIERRALCEIDNSD